LRKAVRVCVPGYGHYWLWVVTYETRQALKDAAEKYAGFQLDMSVDEEDGIEGCFTDYLLRGSYLGIMRLYDVSMQTIIHESVHAGSCLSKKTHGKSRTLSQEKEEAIAYGAEAIAIAVADAVFGCVP
jgi:hypothetical protein